MGHTVLESACGCAIAEFSRGDVDVVLLDCRLPDSDGIAVLRAHEDDVAERRRDPDDRVSDDRERRRRRDVRCMRLPGQAIRSR